MEPINKVRVAKLGMEMSL